jgi:hypothetical protein
MFATEKEIEYNERRKAKLENAGYSLKHSTPSILVYIAPGA